MSEPNHPHQKLYIVVNSEIAPGLMLAQAVHAAVEFLQMYPEKAASWKPSNNVVVLSHDNLAEKVTLLREQGLAVAEFYEPDLNNTLTAICTEPGAGRYLSNLPLALRTSRERKPRRVSESQVSV